MHDLCSFLSVMFLFGLGNLILKYKRSKIPRAGMCVQAQRQWCLSPWHALVSASYALLQLSCCAAILPIYPPNLRKMLLCEVLIFSHHAADVFTQHCVILMVKRLAVGARVLPFVLIAMGAVLVGLWG